MLENDTAPRDRGHAQQAGHRRQCFRSAEGSEVGCAVATERPALQPLMTASYFMISNIDMRPPSHPSERYLQPYRVEPQLGEADLLGVLAACLPGS